METEHEPRSNPGIRMRHVIERIGPRGVGGSGDTVLVLNDKAANQDEVPYFKYLGYKVDGIEGFVYPKSLPRPLGAVKLMRKYHAGLDDHANFPESASASMGSNGWTYDTNATDWLGYVYPNTGSMPTIQ